MVKIHQNVRIALNKLNRNKWPILVLRILKIELSNSDQVITDQSNQFSDRDSDEASDRTQEIWDLNESEIMCENNFIINKYRTVLY